MLSAFGVDHGGLVSKGDKDRAQHYGRMAAATGGLGALASGVGVGAGIVGEAERRGHDPMGFTKPMTPGGGRAGGKPPMSPALKARLIRGTAKAHGKQALVMGGIGAAGLGIGGAYKHKQKKELSKADRRKVGDVALGTGAAGLGGGAVYAGTKQAHHMGQDVVQAGKNIGVWRHNRKNDATVNSKFWRHAGRLDKGVLAVKGPAVAASLGAGALGAAGVAELARYHAKNRKKS